MDCVFCKIVRREEPAEIVYEDDVSLAFLDNHPQTRGHIQLVPKKHYRWIYEIPDMEKLFVTAKRLIHVIISVLGPDHVTISTFGHQIDHAHVWIVPQYKGERLYEAGRHRATEEALSTTAKQLREAIH